MMNTQRKFATANVIAVVGIIVTIILVGWASSSALYSAVNSNLADQNQINVRHDKEINALLEKERRNDERWEAVIKSQARIEGALGIKGKEPK